MINGKRIAVVVLACDAEEMTSAEIRPRRLTAGVQPRKDIGNQADQFTH
jgi:hypothetical protein